MELSNILMWIFVILMLIGIWLSYRTIAYGQKFVNEYEGPIVVGIGLLLSVLTAIVSGGETTEGFKSLYGLN